MGNCLASLFGRPKRPRSYFTGRYKDYNVGVEFDNLIEDENDVGEGSNVVSQSERELLVNKQFSKLVENQRRVDAEIDAELRQEEERTRLEEEAYIAAKKEAARIARQARKLEEQKKNKPVSNGSVKSWAGDDGDWSMANEEEDDFDSFLQTVTARSENVRASVASLTNSHLAHHSHPNNMLQSDLLTFDLPWQDLPGIGGFLEVKPASIPTLISSTLTDPKPFQDSTSADLFSSHKSDVEWEADFVSAEITTAPSLPVSGAGDARPIPDGGHSTQNGDLKMFPESVDLRAEEGWSEPPVGEGSNGLPTDTNKPIKENSGGVDERVKDGSSGPPAESVGSERLTDTNVSENGVRLRGERSTRESFSITDEEEEDEEILDIESESTKPSGESGGPVLGGVNSKGSPKVEAEAFDIDIDKFLEELDAEL